jgi:hypothetical protein
VQRFKESYPGGRRAPTAQHWIGAIANNIQQGGWCPAGRRAEDGVIPDLYCLRETPQRDYRQQQRCDADHHANGRTHRRVAFYTGMGSENLSAMLACLSL